MSGIAAEKLPETTVAPEVKRGEMAWLQIPKYGGKDFGMEGKNSLLKKILHL